jgi:pimeloyl-ACP methyl ester carboxylesterase
MPFVALRNSPHANGVAPVTIHYREVGSGAPLVFLHGGWGYEAYPIDRQLEALSSDFRFIIPDRSGHGRSTPFHGPLPIDFHRRAAEETLLFLDALEIQRAIFWGHSDGAVIAAMIGLRAPARCEHLVLEAFHFYRNKPASNLTFFQRFADRPRDVGEKLRARLAADHGQEMWPHVVSRNCRVWLQLAAQSARPDEDLYGGNLGELRVPVTFMHGRGDPRTEPGEIDRARAALPGSRIHWFENGRHSPHSESAAWLECNAVLAKALTSKLLL